MRLLITALLFASACAPTINIRRERPPAIQLAPSVRSVNVVGSQNSLVMQILSAEVREQGALSELAAEHIQGELANRRIFAVIAGCETPCMRSDATVQVALVNKEFLPPTWNKKDPKKVDAAAKGAATIQVQVLQNNGALAFSGQFSATRYGSSSDPSRDGDLLGPAVIDAADKFVDGVSRHEEDDFFALRKKDELEQANKLFSEGQTDQALEAYRQIAGADPQNADALYSVGVAWLAKGELDEARDAFARAEAINNGFAWARKNAEQRIAERAVLMQMQ